VKLVDRKHGSCRVIDRRRECLDCDVHQNSEGERRVLLQGSL
jgi:hypothetical protein